MTKTIPLTQNKFAVVDDEDYEKLSQFRWRAAKLSNGKFYAVRTAKVGSGQPENVYMHREVMGVVSQNGEMVDHKNEEQTLNNQKSNLRLSTRSQNKANTKKYKNNKSGYKGVYKRHGKYQAQIRTHNKLISIGNFDSPEDAAKAYDEAAQKYHGEFAKTNF